MAEVLRFDQLALDAEGPTLTLSLEPGSVLAVCGPAASGKSALLRVVAGADRPARGSARATSCMAAQAHPSPRKTKVGPYARHMAGSRSSASDLLVATHLTAVTESTLAELSPSQVAAAELLGPLVSDAAVLALDGQLDRLDPWVLHRIQQWIRARHDSACVIATHRPDLIAWADLVIVLKDRQMRFAGTTAELLAALPHQEYFVQTERHATVRALCEPFEVSVQETDGGLRLSAGPDQDIASRMLVEGYGDVAFAISRPPTITEALLELG